SQQLEQTMNEVFAKDRPDAALEQRTIAKLRQRRIRRASILRFIGAAAAVLVLGLIGAALQAVAFSDTVKTRGGAPNSAVVTLFDISGSMARAKNHMREIDG